MLKAIITQNGFREVGEWDYYSHIILTVDEYSALKQGTAADQDNRITLTLEQAASLKSCPKCNRSLMDDEDRTRLIYWSDRDKDGITYFECPVCKTKFLRAY